VAVQLTLQGNVCKDIRIGLTNVNPTSMRAIEAEARLKGQPLSDDNVKAAAKLGASACDPSADLRGSPEYKRDVTRVLLERAVRLAQSRVKGAN
jgi:aerobic carbon-monoxide dehydrogenase medium subunit